MNYSPLVTIVIPVYNAGQYLRPAVESIINQTYRNLEIIIVDDGSTDDCIESIQDLIANDKRILTMQQQNSGKSVALNRALDMKKGEFWAIHDADDISHPERIEKQVSALVTANEVAAVFSGYDLLLGGKHFAPVFKFKGIERCKKSIEVYRMPAHDPTGLYRVSMIGDLRFDEELRIGQGHDYILRVGERFPVVVIGDCLYSYRINYNSNTRKNAQQRSAYIAQVLKKAQQRRGSHLDTVLMGSKRKDSTKRRVGANEIVSHCMESVLDLKRNGRFLEALKVAIVSCALRPFDLHFYKPLGYFITPTKLIASYRSSKGKMK